MNLILPLLTRSEKIAFIASVFPYKTSFLEGMVIAEISLFYECDSYRVDDFVCEICRLFHCVSFPPYPERKITQFTQLTLF